MRNAQRGFAASTNSTTEALGVYVEDPDAAIVFLLSIAGDGPKAGWLAVGLMLGIDMERSRDR